MNTMRSFLAVIVLAILTTLSSEMRAQTVISPNGSASTATVQNKGEAKEGTFQFMIQNDKMKEYFTTDVLQKIEAARDQKEVKIIRISDRTRVRILPYDVINDPKFSPLQELYIFDGPND